METTTRSMETEPTSTCVVVTTAPSASQDDTIAEEFCKLNNIYQGYLDQLLQQGVMLFASATQRDNYHKNRYSNVLAMESTRVKLQRHMDCYIDTDYINANYINGEVPGSERAYISCQAPLPTTLLAFWLMIWEQQSSVIVMLTRLTERDKLKAIVYWPENIGDTREFGPISVTLKKTKQVDAYLEMRTFEVICEGVKRQIVQFHYVEWPDFGVPSSTSTIRALICLMDLYILKGKNTQGLRGPVITHCSAGVGRTGTFLAVHICMEKMKHYNSLDHINIPRTVMLLRQSRNGMVQTQEQYQFIYEVVKDARSELRERAQRVFAAPSLTLANHTTTSGHHHLHYSSPTTMHSTVDGSTACGSLNLSAFTSASTTKRLSHKRMHPDTPTIVVVSHHPDGNHNSGNGGSGGSGGRGRMSASSSGQQQRHTGKNSSKSNNKEKDKTEEDDDDGADDVVVFCCLEKKRRLSFSTCI